MGVPGRQVVVRRQPQQPREEVGAKPCRASVLPANLLVLSQFAFLLRRLASKSANMVQQVTLMRKEARMTGPVVVCIASLSSMGQQRRLPGKKKNQRKQESKRVPVWVASR